MSYVIPRDMTDYVARVNAYLVGRVTGDWTDHDIVRHAIPEVPAFMVDRIVDVMIAANA